jgi:hypothetical protein
MQKGMGNYLNLAATVSPWPLMANEVRETTPHFPSFM